MDILPLISTTDALQRFCDQVASSPFITVDTEFMRENTYWPILCLVQVANDKVAAAIDPLAPGIDLAPLLDLLVNNDQLLKVFHAGSQDIEIIVHMTGKTPQPVFDTQIGVMAVGQAEQVGYANLVESWLGITVDKGARFTDWSRRPLEPRQIDYAIADVTHLSVIFPKMLDKLMATGRGAWLDEEMERLADPANYRVEPDAAWQRIKIPSRKPEVIGRLQALAAWRETEAQAKDLPRGRIAKDETLADLAGNPPRSQDDLGRVRGLSAAWRSNDIGARLMAALANSAPIAREAMPEAPPRTPGLGKDGGLVADLLKLLLKIRARELNVAARLLARSNELDALAAGQRTGLQLLEGWRFDAFGRLAIDLVEGRTGFAIVRGKLKMTALEADGGDAAPDTI